MSLVLSSSPMQMLFFNMAGPRVIKDTPSSIRWKHDLFTVFLISLPLCKRECEFFLNFSDSAVFKPSITMFGSPVLPALRQNHLRHFLGCNPPFCHISGTYSHIRDLHYAWSERYVTCGTTYFETFMQQFRNLSQSSQVVHREIP